MTVDNIRFTMSNTDKKTNGKLSKPGANPIKISMPTPKFWSWRNYENSLFQSYKAVS